MENASKALIMAGSVLIALMIIGAFMLMMNGLTDYQEKSYQSTANQQTLEFNNQYATYDRDNIRGSDMVSLMNRVIDYNNRKTQEGYIKMEVTITIPENIRKNLAYGNTNELIKQGTYTENDISLIVGDPSSNDGIREIENTYTQKYANQLAAEISSIATIANNTSLTPEQKRKEFDDEFRFPKKAKEYYPTGDSVESIYNDALVYYEYVQFKRAYFDCTETEYDRDTGRIIKMNFECTGIGV